MTILTRCWHGYWAALTLGACGLAGPAAQPGAAGSAGIAQGERSVDQAGLQPGAAVTPAVTAPPAAAEPGAPAYPGSGFIVHEWGTNTLVVGSDGSLQRGLHHEGDDLPAFVFDRLKQGELLGFPSSDKMETPVDYFYSDQPRSVTVRVDMPRGVLTQWYPAVAAFSPAVLVPSFGPAPLVDPVSAIDFPYASPSCSQKYTSLTGGMLDWGQVEILAREVTLAEPLPDAPLDRFTWSYARQVAANAVRVRNPIGRADTTVLITPQTERFLFYRGLGNFTPPSTVTASEGRGAETIRIATPSAGPIFVLNVGATTAAFRQLTAMPDQNAIETAVPDLAAGLALDAFVDDLTQALITALGGTGLYRDEAVAMVNTWSHQWFRTPGVRVLYFAPASWLDRELPLTIIPTPDFTTRVMVMRVEVLTHATERADLAAIREIAGTARSYFLALGRFAEPRLRRALQLWGEPNAGLDLLAEIQGPNASSRFGE